MENITIIVGTLVVSGILTVVNDGKSNGGKCEFGGIFSPQWNDVLVTSFSKGGYGCVT